MSRLPRLLLSTVSVMSILTLALSVQAADPLSPRVEVSAKGGNKRSILSTQIWAPLAQRDDRVLYADVRLMGDNDENREGNFGLGYREINPYTNTVIGFHGWYDQRRTENDSTFRQLTFGAESLGHVWDMRVNGYVPLNSGRVFDPGTATISNPYLAGTGIFYDINGLLVETPQYGVDGEVGYRLPVLQDKADAIRVFGGGYHFFRDNTDNVTGFRVRTEATINSAFSLGARYQYDEPRGSQGFLEATIRFPFGAKKLYQAEGLRSRLDESAERDVDIVTSAKAAPIQQAVARNATGAQQRILYVDNTAATGGDGSLDNPFSTLKDAEAALRAHDILYVHHGDGTTTGMDQGIVIDKANISLIGSGSDLSYAGHTLIAAGLAPTITNTDAYVDDGKGTFTSYTGNGVLVTGANGYISGITIDGAQSNGIQVIADNVNHQSSVLTNGQVGNILVSNVTTNNNTYAGINITSNMGIIQGITLENITANDNSDNGIYIASTATGQIDTVFLNNVTTTRSGKNGIKLLADSNSVIHNLTLQDITVDNSNKYGIATDSNNNAYIGTILYSRVHVRYSTEYGAYAHANSGNIGSFHVLDSVFENNGSSGILARASGGYHLNSVIFENIESYYNNSGIHIQAGLGGIIDNAVINGAVSLNNTTGIHLHSFSANDSNMHVAMNAIHSENNERGLHANAGNNTNLTATLTNSTITNNSDSGLFLNSETTGTFDFSLGSGLPGQGNNRIFNNNTDNTGAGDIKLDLNGSELSAQGNWWGQAGGPIAGQIVNEGACPSCGTADTSNALDTDPLI